MGTARYVLERNGSAVLLSCVAQRIVKVRSVVIWQFWFGELLRVEFCRGDVRYGKALQILSCMLSYARVGCFEAC